MNDEVRGPAVRGGRRAAFLDRDGVLNIDTGYLYRPDELMLTPTAIEGVRMLNDAAYLVVVVTNQSGIARGYYSEADVDALHAHMRTLFSRHGARIDAFYYCGYHPDGVVPAFMCEHEDRKPNAGMIKRAIRDWGIEPKGSFLIGDKPSDMEAARRAGLPGICVPRNECDLAATARAALAVHAGRSDLMPQTAD